MTHRTLITALFAAPAAVGLVALTGCEGEGEIETTTGDAYEDTTGTTPGTAGGYGTTGDEPDAQTAGQRQGGMTPRQDGTFDDDRTGGIQGGTTGDTQSGVQGGTTGGTQGGFQGGTQGGTTGGMQGGTQGGATGGTTGGVGDEPAGGTGAGGAGGTGGTTGGTTGGAGGGN